MASPEFRPDQLRKILITGAAVVFAACSSNVVPEVSATTDGHIIDVAGEAFIVRYPDDELLLGDLPGGLSPIKSIEKAKRYMRIKGCDLFDPQIAVGLSPEKTEEIVQVKNSCLPELK